MLWSIRSNLWFSIPRLAESGEGMQALLSTLERGAGAAVGDAWDEQFQQCCYVLRFGMGQNLLLLLVSTSAALGGAGCCPEHVIGPVPMSPALHLTFGLYLHPSGRQIPVPYAALR